MIAHQKRRFEAALAAIDQTNLVLSRDESTDLWEILRTVIGVFKVQNDWEWTKKYYSQEACEKIEERLQNAPELAVQGQRDWATLLTEVEEAVTRRIAPSSEEARSLAERWGALLAQFTQGDAEIQRGLNRLWADSTHWPRDFKRPWSDAADAFIKAALNCKRNGAVDGD